MTEQIYIDGTLMELDCNKVNVQLIYQSPILVDFQQIVSNRTTQVTLPPTNHNLAAIGYTSTQVDSNFAYQKHAVIYKRDGVQLLKGIATLLGVKKDGIVFCFTWGNVQALQALFDTKLRDITSHNQYDLSYVQYPPENAFQMDYKNKLNFGGGRKGVSIKLNTLLYSMQLQLGFTGLSDLAYIVGDSDEGIGLSMALPTKTGDTTTKALQKINSNGDCTGGSIYGYSQYRPWAFMIGLKSGATDVHHYYDSDDMVFRVNGSKLHLKLKGVIEAVYSYYDQGGVSDFELLKMSSLDASGYADNPDKVTICSVEIVSHETGLYNVRYTFDYDGEINVEGFDYVGLRLTRFGNMDGQSMGITSKTIDKFEMTYDEDLPEDVVYGTGISAYPVHLNLPDMSCGQLIKNLLWLRGEFAYSKDGKTFQLVSFNDLIANKANAVDWTMKLKGKPTEWTSTLEGTAQRNYFRYAEADHYDNTLYQGMLQTEDATIQEETEYCVSDFALAPNNMLPVWIQNEDGEWDFEGDNVPAVLLASDVYDGGYTRAAYMQEQLWENLLAEHYGPYANIIRKPVVLKANLVLTTYDLFTLDLTIPVYLQQTGHYYLIRKLSVKGSADCDVELIKI